MLASQVVHRAVRDDPPVLEDGDAVAHRFGDLERVGAHQYRAAAPHELAEDVLQEARRLGIEPDHRLLPRAALRPVNESAPEAELASHAGHLGPHPPRTLTPGSSSHPRL